MPDTAPHIQIVIGSIRPNRAGEPVARWFAQLAGRRDDLTFELVDLREWDLPLFAAPVSPAKEYVTDKQRAWAAKVGEADGYVLVTPEYNHGYPPSLKNALDHVYAEWNRKPVACVGYGGPGGGTRAVEQLRCVAVELQMAPVRAQVIVNRPWPHISEGIFDGEHWEGQATRLLDDLAWWAAALRDARAGTA